MTDAELRRLALRWQHEGRQAVWVEVIEARGSVPRGVGAAMLVTADEAWGSIGGGHLEWQALALARAGRFGEHPFALGPSLGQCCGGALRLRLLPLADWQPTALPPPRFHLELYGAGHVGRALVRLLSDLPCSVRWIDAREDEPFPALPPHIEVLHSEGAEPCPEGAHVRVMTHRHDLDLRITEQLLREGRCASLGVIGSATKAARFRRHLQAKGLPAERMQCPTGLPGIAGKEPAVIALAVAAELLQAGSAKR